MSGVLALGGFAPRLPEQVKRDCETSPALQTRLKPNPGPKPSLEGCGTRRSDSFLGSWWRSRESRVPSLK